MIFVEIDKRRDMKQNDEEKNTNIHRAEVERRRGKYGV